MGKGGQKTASAPAEGSAPVAKINVGPMKLDHLHTEELKKWAKAYGVDAEAERDQLLSSLVRKDRKRERMQQQTDGYQLHYHYSSTTQPFLHCEHF